MFAADIRFWLGVVALVALVIITAIIAVLGFWRLPEYPLATVTEFRKADACRRSGGYRRLGGFYLCHDHHVAHGIPKLPAVVAVEEKGGLVRACHELAHGNVWRPCSPVALALGLPIFFLLVAAEAAIVGTSLSPDVIAQGNPAAP